MFVTCLGTSDEPEQISQHVADRFGLALDDLLNSVPVVPKYGKSADACTVFCAARNKRSLVRNLYRSTRFPCTALPLQQRLAALQLVLPGGGRLSARESPRLGPSETESGVNSSHWTEPEPGPGRGDLSLT